MQKFFEGVGKDRHFPWRKRAPQTAFRRLRGWVIRRLQVDFRLVGAGVRQQGTDLSQERIHLFRAAADVGGGREDRLHLFFRHAEGGLGGQTGQ